jgi:hypothetical protein
LIALQRVQGSLEFAPGQPREFRFDAGAGIFFLSSTRSPTPFQSLPPEGTCTSYTGAFEPSVLRQFGIGSFLGEFDRPLPEGEAVTIDGEGSRRAVLRAGKAPGPYTGLLGGALPLISGAETPPFLTPGSYRIRGGGTDRIREFEARLDIPPAFEWVNPPQEIDRANGVDVPWRGLRKDRQMVLAAASVDTLSTTMGTCICVAPPGVAQMRIPPYALQNFPATPEVGGLPLRVLVLASIPSSVRTAPRVAGLDELRAVFLDIQSRTVRFR